MRANTSHLRLRSSSFLSRLAYYHPWPIQQIRLPIRRLHPTKRPLLHRRREFTIRDIARLLASPLRAQRRRKDRSEGPDPPSQPTNNYSIYPELSPPTTRYYVLPPLPLRLLHHQKNHMPPLRHPHLSHLRLHPTSRMGIKRNSATRTLQMRQRRNKGRDIVC